MTKPLRFYENIKNSTYQISCGSSKGSGFALCHQGYIVTCYHVIESHFKGRQKIEVKDTEGLSYETKLLSFSETSRFDFALLKVTSNLPENRRFLEPLKDRPTISDHLKMAGFPCGMNDLLVHDASVSGFHKNFAFYMDGTVIPGFSGGPIIDFSSQKVVGITTWSRLAGQDVLGNLRSNLSKLSVTLTELQSNPDFHFAKKFFDVAEGIKKGHQGVLDILDWNFNSGIGAGFFIEYALEDFYDFEIVKED